jgi:hypothetical protein
MMSSKFRKLTEFRSTQSCGVVPRSLAAASTFCWGNQVTCILKKKKKKRGWETKSQGSEYLVLSVSASHLTMFVRSCQEKHGTTCQPHVSSNYVTSNGSVGMANMRLIIHIVYRTSDIIGACSIVKRCGKWIIYRGDSTTATTAATTQCKSSP